MKTNQNPHPDDPKRIEALKQARETLHSEVKSKDKSRIQVAYQNLKTIFVGNDALWANEVQANWMVALIEAVIVAVLLLTLLLTAVGVFQLNLKRLIGFFIACIVEMVYGITLCVVVKGEKSWLKFAEITMVCLAMACIYAVIGSRASLLMALPVVLSIRYMSEKITRVTALMTAVLILLGTVMFAFTGAAPDLNCIPFEDGSTWTVAGTIDETVAAKGYSVRQYLSNLLSWTYLSNLLQYAVISVISYFVARYCHKTVLKEAEITEKNARIDTELELARHIQVSSLPNTFPAFPDRTEFDLYASMTPAKEIGGDFDDFFLLDSNTLGLVVADVSGKGIPAALFMMRAKTMIKNIASSGQSPAAVFEKVNNLLRESNAENLFVTAWFGKLDLRTGVITAANAGHEYPAVKRAGGQYEIYKDKHGFVLGGMDGMKYKDYELKLEPHDALFLYTDGVTEAANPESELFGVSRMLETLNRYSSESMQGLLEGMIRELGDFKGDAPQFDDITMLGLEFFGKEQQTAAE